ncbi:winged helix-turn-helix domain-containing protein [Serratia sp. AKBS12]|uniref:winged helix-turn-helix domain-containing protein n=1 Tax=Serratia sp. AKBS12 TaxID=2974597 RepID=UPI002165FB20|nr:winged helix-turn-helix domain-containing protein [Serratia sp. AKBS12]MCS3408221.1 winged helix-turn-helix domain-containing protein [Serratia sp. AKBS12]HEI8866037.1 winged helix-turn-helix domain-containing protein [Serratia odorifera]
MDLDKRIKIRNLDVLIPSRKKSRLRWKEYQILSLLVARSPELVSRAEIIENIWKGTYCSDSTINQTIKSIRQKIGDKEHLLIRTIPRLGYKVENSGAFHFINEETDNDADDIYPEGTVDKDNIQAEMSEKESHLQTVNQDKVSTVADNMAQTETNTASPLRRNSDSAQESRRSRGFFSLPTARVVTYLSVLASLLVISHLAFLLGNQVRPPIVNDIQNNTRVMLALTLNDPHAKAPQTLLCLYQGERQTLATLECIDPRRGQFRQPVKYDAENAFDGGLLKLILPDSNLEYRVAYDVKN